jgi:hypothetical protein
LREDGNGVVDVNRGGRCMKEREKSSSIERAKKREREQKMRGESAWPQT